MSADSPRRNIRGVPATVPPQVVNDRSIIDSVAGFINDVTLAHQPQCDPKDTITWARFETTADISDPRFGEDWELEGNVAPPLLLILGYGQGVQVWAIPANGEAVEVLSWRHGMVSALRILPTPSIAENGRADEPVDTYSEKRPLMAICDGTTPAGSNPQFCAINFVSLKVGAQVKTIKFKNPVLDILANRSSIVITFHERIAVFDARSLEDRLSITTCFPSPGINPNPVALGSRWMAYSENKLLHSKRSGGGCDGDGVSSYTATVLNAAKSFGKGLRELGEQVAAGLTGTSSSSGLTSKSSSFDSGTGDVRQPGVVTILDIKNPIRDVSPTSGTPISINGSDPIVAHFIAHSEAVVAIEFDNSGMMLLTADRRGHDFHIFRIQPHPVGSSLAAVHHLYVLHRGDTSAKVQNIAFSLDSRWVAVSTLRGTTHVFPITPYGGPAGVRTHTSLHVVNKLSRFHRSAGLTADGRSSSPISHSDSTNFSQVLMPYHNPTLPPFPRPTVVLPLAQLRQPFVLGSPPGSATSTTYTKPSSTRQRLSSLSDDNGKPLSVCAVFAKSRSWLLDPPNMAREAPHKIQRKAVDSLFIMAGHGSLIQYDLDTKLATTIAKEKICDDTPIELEVEAKAQWNLGRKDGSPEITAPLLSDNWLIKDRNSCMLIDSTRQFDDNDGRCDSWLSQVEIITHAGPHRRLWMGPQFVFKTYNTPSGSNLSHIDIEAVEIGVTPGPSNTCRPERSSPLNMPISAASRSSVPVLIESGSYSSIEQSPKLMDRFRHEHMNSDYSVAHGDTRLKEDLADAMRESPSVSHKDAGEHLDGCRFSTSGSSRTTTFSTPSSSPLIGRCERRADYGDITSSTISSASSSNTTVIVGGDRTTSSPMLTSTAMSSSHYESFESLIQEEPPQQQPFKSISIENVVNPLGTVTTILGNYNHNEVDDIMKEISEQDYIIHENCDESLFRPVVTIFCDDEKRRLDEKTTEEISEYTKPPEAIPNKLVVPVIEKSVDQEITRMEILKTNMKKHQKQVELKDDSDDEVVEFNVIHLNKKLKEKEKQKIQTNKDSHAVPHSSKEVIRAEIKPKRCDKVSSKIDIERVIKDEVLYPRENDKKDIEFLKDLERSEQISTTQKEKNSLQLKQRGKSDAMVDKEIVTKGSTSGCQEKQQVQETKRREKVSSSTEKASIEKVQTSGKKNYKKGSVKESENVNRDEVEHLETSKKEKHKTRTSVESSYIEDVSLRCKKPDASGLDELVPSNSVSSSASKLTKESLSVSSEHDDSNQKECTSSTREKITKKRRSLTSKADEKTNSPVGTELVNKEDDLSTQEDLNKKLKKTEQKKQQSVKDTIQSDDVSGYQERGAAEKQLAAGNHDSKGSIKESEDVNRVNVLSSPDSITKKPTKTEKQNKNDPNQIVSTKRKKITMESRSMSSDNEYPISSELVSSIREQTPADTQRDDSLKQNEKNDSILKAEQEISNTREKGGKKLQKSEKQRAPVVKDRSPNESDSNTPNNVVTKNRTQSSKSDNNKAGPSSTQSPAYYMYIPNKNNKDERQHQSASPDENEPGSLQDETLPSLQGTSKKIKAKANKCTGPFNILGDLDTTKNYKAEMDLSKPTKGVSEGGEISNVETKITKSKTKLPKESKNSEEGQKENSKDGLQKDSVTETTMQTKKNRAKGTESASLQDEATCSPKNSLTGITSSKKHPGKVIEVRSQGEHVDSAQETSPIDMTTLKSEGKSDLISASTQGIHSQSAMNIKENVTKQTEKNSGNTAKDVSQVETDSGAKETSVHSNSDFRKKSSLKTRKINEAGLTNPDMKEDETKNVTKETQDIHSSPDSSVNKNVPLKSETHRHSLNTSKDHSESFVALEEETKVSKIQKSLAIDITSHSLEREVDMTHPSAPTTSNLAVSSKSDTDKRVKSKKECKGITVADEVGTTKELRSKLEKTKYSEKADKDAKNEVLEYASVVKTPPSSSLETEKDQKLSKTKKSENEATNIEKNVKKDASLSLTKLEIKNESSGTSKTRSRTTKNLSPECATVVGLSKIDQKIAKNHTQEAKNEAIEAVSDTPSAEPKGKRDSKAMETNISSKSEITTVENVSKMETKKDSVKPKLIKGTVTRVVTSEALEAETKPDTDSPSISRTQVGRSATSGFDNKYPLIKEDGRQIAENITSSATKAKKTKNSSCDQSVHKVIEAPSNKGVNLVDGQLDLSLLHGDVSVLLVDYCDKLDSDSDTLRMEIDLKHKKINGRGKFERIKVDTLPRSLIRTYATVVAGPDGDNSHILNTEYKLQEESSELVTKFKPKQTVKDDQLREYSDATKKQATSVDPTTVSPKPPNFIYKETHEIHEKSPTKEDQVQKCRDAPRLDQQTENKSKNPLEFSATVQKNTGIMEYSDVVKKSLSSSDQTTVGPMMKLRYIKCPDRKPKKSFEIGASESGSIKTNIKDEPKQKYSEVLGKPSTTEDQNTTFTKSAENKCEKTPEIDRPPSHPSTAMNIIMSGDTANPDEWQRKFSDYYNTKLRHVREAYPNLNFNDFIRLSDEEIKEAEMRLERQSSSDLRKYDPKFKNTYPILQKIGIRGNLEGDKKNKTTFYDAHAKKPAEDMWKPNFQDTKGKLHPCHSLEDIKNNDKPWIANSPDDAKTSHSKDLAGLYPFFDTNPPRNYHDSTVASIDSTKKKTTGSKTGDMARTISSNFSIKNDPYEAQNAQKSPITNRYGSSGSGSLTKLTNKDPWDTPRYVEEDFLSDTEYPALSKATKNRKSQSPVSERDQIIQNFSEFMSSLRDENHSLINLESPLQPVKLQPDCPTSSNTKLLPTETPIKLTPTTASGLLKSAPEKPIIPFRYFYIDYDFSLEETETPSSVTPKYRVFDGYNDYEITVDSDPPFTPSFISDDIPSDIEGKDWPKPRHSAFAPDDDEELRPLISNPLKNSQYLPSGMVKKKDTLPPLDNNHEHSDSSSSDQAITSDYYDNQLTLYAGAGSNTSTDNTSATDKSAEGETDLSTNLQSPQQLHSQQLHTNSTKKKLKRRKR